MVKDQSNSDKVPLKIAPFIIAIDGHASCGKSTLAKALADHFNLRYIDTGAMYRAVTYYMLSNHLQLNEVKYYLDKISISFTSANEGNHLLLNGVDREYEIRSPEVNQLVSEVSTILEIREFLVAQQRIMGQQKNVVLDGRDIGTVVYPDAEIKIFVTASSHIRARRRYLEFQSKGTLISIKEIEDNLIHRDTIDSTRTHSPLKQAKEAIVLDTSNMTKSEQLIEAISIINRAIR